MNCADSVEDDSASLRVSNHSTARAPIPGVENLEALLSPPSIRFKKTSNASKNNTGGEKYRVQSMFDAVLPRLEACI